jgi:hypothetical protein
MNRAPEAPTLQQAFEAAKRSERCLQCNPSTLTSSAATTAYTAQTSARPILAKDTAAAAERQRQSWRCLDDCRGCRHRVLRAEHQRFETSSKETARGSDLGMLSLALHRCMAGEDRINPAPPAAAPTCIYAAPGWRVHRLGEWLFSPKTFTAVLEPVLSDMQVEIFEALAAKQPGKARWVQIRGYWNFWHHVVLLILTSVGRLLLALWNSI